ncbi:hypothetical protein JYT86_00725, partial [bacterium AH-315-N03]|nr:hypothetical protein [bacterium AH-315-N03]
FLQGRRPSEIADDRLAYSPNEALKGREVMAEVFDESNAFLSTSFATITNRHLMTGLDGRTIHYAFVSETNELAYDTTPFTPSASGSVLNLSAVVSESTAGDGSVIPGTVERARDVPIRSARLARIRTTFDIVDNLGHVHRQTAHGQVEPDAAALGVDGLIISNTEPVLLNDVGQWIWRTGRTFLTGHDLPGRVGDTSNSYDRRNGDLLSATQVVDSPTQFAFDGESRPRGARGYTQLDEDLVASTIYDPWGNATQSCGGHDLGGAPVGDLSNPPLGCLRFGHVLYDPDYDHFVREEKIAIGRAGITELQSTGTWDRGLGAILTATDPNSLTSTVTYDGLGRLTSVTPPNVGRCTGSSVPTTRIAYELTTDPARQPISRVVSTTELSCTGIGANTLESIAFVDGLGRARAALATGDDTHAWVRSGIVTLDKKGSARRTYQADFFDGSDTDFAAAVALPPAIPYAVIRYDAFGRTRGVIAEDGSVSWTSFHSLSTDVCDPNDNNPASEHYRTCTTARSDGHGRTIDQVLRNRQPDSGVSEQYRLFSYYRADNAVVALARANTTAGRPETFGPGVLTVPHVLRTFTYDSVGRRLSSNDPDTDDPGDSDVRTRSWRYLFNRVGDLAAVRDPRGCGQNFFYDLGGRMAGEQYVGCIEAQPHDAEAPPSDNDVGNLISQDVLGANVALDSVYYYDEYPVWLPLPGDADAVPTDASGVLGRATGVTDRGQRAALAYDDRGNVIWTTRQIALIPRELGLFGMASDSDPPDQLERPGPRGTVDYDERHTYTRTAEFDHASRPVSTVLPSDPDFAGGSALLVEGLLSYNRRGLPRAASARIDGTLYPIVTGIAYLRDALVGSITYGDASPSRAATRSATTYDVRRRPVHMRTTRAADPMAAPETLGVVSTVVDQRLVWDPANNLTGIIDHRDAGEWPVGHLPQSVHIRHDALYRVINADYDYRQPTSGARTVHDLGTDWRANLRASATMDPMREEPPDMAPTLPPSRVINLNWSWDYLANQTEWDDDQQSFYERSIGRIDNGDALSDTLRPSALYLASNVDVAGGTDRGWVEVDYGEGGNMRAMTVHAQCTDAGPSMVSCVDSGTDLADRRAALRAGCACAVEQHYVYRWDELNRLAEARRYDRSAMTGGEWVLETRQRYRYDGANARVIKQTLDQNG